MACESGGCGVNVGLDVGRADVVVGGKSATDAHVEHTASVEAVLCFALKTVTGSWILIFV